MESGTFLKKRLKEIFSVIENIEIVYEYRNTISTHLVEIKPLDLFSKNKKYIDKEIDLEKEFFELFPGEELVFLSEDSLIQIKNKDFILPSPTLLKVSYCSKETRYDVDGLKQIKIFQNLYNNYALAA